MQAVAGEACPASSCSCRQAEGLRTLSDIRCWLSALGGRLAGSPVAATTAAANAASVAPAASHPSAASQPFAPATARQRSTTARRHIVAASAGAPQQPGQALERRQLLLGGAALPVFAALGSVRPAQADEFECQPKASPSGIKWCDIAEGFGEPATAGKFGPRGSLP